MRGNPFVNASSYRFLLCSEVLGVAFLSVFITGGRLGCFLVEVIISGAAFPLHVDDGDTCGFLSVGLPSHRAA